jgi:hypothetical protein
MDIAEPQSRTTRVGPRAGLFVLSLLPGLVAFLPGVSRALWNFTDPVQQTYLTPVRIVVLSALLVAVCAPLVVAGIVLMATWARHRSGAVAFEAAARCAAVLGGVAFVAVMLTGGGF